MTFASRRSRSSRRPAHLLREFPATEPAAATTFEARAAIHRILHGADDRLLVVVGPCSIHDSDAAMDYARSLAAEAERHWRRSADPDARLFREAAHDGRLEGADQRSAPRRQLQDQRGPAPGAQAPAGRSTNSGLPCGTEFLDIITPQYIADLIAWGAIGARTTESQVHRELASGLSCPVGFKNGTDGNVRIAVDAIKAAASPHHFLSVTKAGHSAIVHHQRQRGLPRHPARRQGSPTTTPPASTPPASELAKAGPGRARHDRSSRTPTAARSTSARSRSARDVAGADRRRRGPHLRRHGRIATSRKAARTCCPASRSHYGVSITDACIGWDDTVTVLDPLAAAVRKRRLALADR